MLPPQEMIDRLAERIERAFSLRHRPWYSGCSTPRVWAAAAHALWEATSRNPLLPLDPELYVASQPIHRRFADPWSSLTGPVAANRYESRVRRIIRQLRRELRPEVHRAEVMLQLGHGLARVMKGADSRFSPLGLYITAHRAGRADLAGRLRQRVIQQHDSCPLYRLACQPLLPLDDYPIVIRWQTQPDSTTPSMPDPLVQFD